MCVASQYWKPGFNTGSQWPVRRPVLPESEIGFVGKNAFGALTRHATVINYIHSQHMIRSDIRFATTHARMHALGPQTLSPGQGCSRFRAAHFSAGIVVATRFLEYSVNLWTRLFLKLSYSLLLNWINGCAVKNCLCKQIALNKETYFYPVLTQLT